MTGSSILNVPTTRGYSGAARPLAIVIAVGPVAGGPQPRHGRLSAESLRESDIRCVNVAAALTTT